MTNVVELYILCKLLKIKHLMYFGVDKNSIFFKFAFLA